MSDSEYDLLYKLPSKVKHHILFIGANSPNITIVHERLKQIGEEALLRELQSDLKSNAPTGYPVQLIDF